MESSVGGRPSTALIRRPMAWTGILYNAKCFALIGTVGDAKPYPYQIAGWLRHRGWTLHVDPAARLTWPVLPFNPYANAPEKNLRHAVGVLTVPVTVRPPPRDAPLDWRRGEIVFELEAPGTGD